MARCENCGAIINLATRFCPECGMPFSAEAVEAAKKAENEKNNLKSETVENTSTSTHSDIHDFYGTSVETTPANNNSETKANSTPPSEPEKKPVEIKPDFSANTTPPQAVKTIVSAEKTPPYSNNNKNNVKPVQKKNSKHDSAPVVYAPPAPKSKVWVVAVLLILGVGTYAAYSAGLFDSVMNNDIPDTDTSETTVVGITEETEAQRIETTTVTETTVSETTTEKTTTTEATTSETIVSNEPEQEMIITEETTASETTAETTTVTETVSEAVETTVPVIIEETEPSIAETTVAETTIIETTVSETTVSETTVIETTASETTSEITTTAETTETTVTSVSEVSKTEAIETTAASEDIIIHPKHTVANGNDISARISLNSEGITPEMLSADTLIIAEYDGDALINSFNLSPVIAVVTIGDTAFEITASSSSDGKVIFEYGNILSAAKRSELNPENIDIISFRSNGTEIDVHSITITRE